MRSFTCAAASQPPWLALGAFVVHYRGHKHVRLRNLLPRGKKKTLFVHYCCSRSRAEKKQRHSVIPILFPASLHQEFGMEIVENFRIFKVLNAHTISKLNVLFSKGYVPEYLTFDIF